MNLHELPTLTMSQLLASLKQEPEAPLRVIWPDGEAIEPHFHFTEIGRVQKDFIDCGGTVRQLRSCLLQTWVGDDTDHRLTAEKLTKAFAAAGPVLKGEDLPVELEYDACNVVQLRLVAVEKTPDGLDLLLAKKHTDCLAKELCVPATCGTSAKGCC
jgi:hypothetical protein